MLRLIVLLTSVVCCNACRLETVNQETTNTPGCIDSDGNLHEFNSDWGNEHEICVCVDSVEYGIICCERFDHTQPEPTTEIFYDNFGAFTENDLGETEEEPSIGDEEQAPNQPDSSDSPEVIGDSPEVIGDSPEVVSDEDSE
ncbi:uncharacterized protein LOC143746404 [Siphateles boraxobius]|uniref:uncharacterized protein LOC143746404 n=1 Tax=Siphateles boraxobius TaxID=180520 RepID=UPI004064B82A